MGHPAFVADWAGSDAEQLCYADLSDPHSLNCVSPKLPDFGIIARTDARSVEGLDSALERGRRYVALGVDALFVESPLSIDELRRIGESFTVPLIVNAAESGKTPILSPEEYRRLGFSMILYPATLLLRMIGTFQRTLTALREGRFANEGPLPNFQELTDVMGMKEWMAIDQQFGNKEA